MDETRLELKVGALILLAIAGSLALLWLMGELTFGTAAGWRSTSATRATS